MNQAFETKHIDTAVGISTHFQSAERLCTLDFLLRQTAPPEPVKSPLPTITSVPMRPFPADAANLVRKVEITRDMTFREASAPTMDAATTAPAIAAKTNKSVPADMAGLLPEALEAWMESKLKKGLRPKAIECCKGYRRKLIEFFGAIRLTDISALSFAAYQEWRSKTAGGSAINHELNALSQVLRRAGLSGLWKAISDDYAPLKESAWENPKTFTTREQKLIFDCASNDPSTQLAYIVAKITRNTTASGCELRGLRLSNLELEAQPPRIHIPPDATKNSVRPRTIPLNDEALEAFKDAVTRATKLGCHAPYHFLFPLRINRRRWDPDRRASNSWLKKQFGKLREQTGIKHLRPHAFRHLAVTELLESGAPEQTVIAVAGWVSRKMIDRYSHTRIEAKMDAVNLLAPHGDEGRAKRAPHSNPREAKVVNMGSYLRKA